MTARHARPRPKLRIPKSALSLATALALIAGAILSSIGAEPASAAYGSGDIGVWTGLTHGTLGDPSTAEAVLVGDSITTATGAATRDQVAAAGHTLAVNYWSGRPTKDAVDWILALPVIPKRVILASGTNDLFDPPAYGVQLARLKAGVPADVRIMVVDVQAARPDSTTSTKVADQRNTGWLNLQIREQFAPADIIGWFRMFAVQPNRIGLYLKPDGIHTNGTTGDAFRVAVVAPPIIAALGGPLPTKAKKR
jgi:hypothetical protein